MRKQNHSVIDVIRTKNLQKKSLNLYQYKEKDTESISNKEEQEINQNVTYKKS